ncbi:MAG: glycosyltransferase 87 family protein [Chloroflexi bacterium]|nr:glycosyltransferase 87 family protein [Chloroflexota bacterium]
MKRSRLTIIVLVFTLSRLLLAAVRVPLLVGSDKFFDYRFFLEMSQLSDQGWYPYLHYWSEYPPLFPWASVGMYRFSALLGGGLATEAAYYTLTTLLRIAGEVGSLVVLSQIARDVWGDMVAERSALLYALLFVPYYLWNGAFDSLPVFFFLWALLLLIRNRDKWSAVAAALGAATKIFPALIVPIAMCSLPGWRRRTLYLSCFLVVLALICVPFLLANPAMTIASLRNVMGRNAWLTIWALVEDYYGAGGVAPLAQRFDPSSALLGDSQAGFWWPVTVVFGALFALFFWQWWRKQHTIKQRDPLQIVAAAGFSLHLLLLYSRGYSPQFLMWMAPLIAVLFPNRRGVLYLATLGLVNLVEYPLYLKFFPDATALLVFVVLARTLLIAIIAVNDLALAWRTRSQPGIAPAEAALASRQTS